MVPILLVINTFLLLLLLVVVIFLIKARLRQWLGTRD